MDNLINLNNEESELFHILMEVVKTRSPQTTVYVAGGWVRDKLLNKSPKDIDLMVETMSGEAFAKLVTDYLGVKGPHVIDSNPEKSKHITTATAQIPLPSGAILPVDFAQARTEIYEPGSRVPSEVHPATAREDVSRRDLTVNALLYNINQDKLEDFTGQGIQDLNNKILRAPGVPKKRFMEDPLRVMRAARFAGKLGWKIEPETKAAMGDPEVLARMFSMTASERIGEELMGLAMTSYPEKGFQDLKETGVLDALLNRSISGTKYNGEMDPWDMGQDSPHHDMKLWEHTIAAVRNISSKYPDGSPEKAMAVLSALLHDTGKMYGGTRQRHPAGHTSYHGHETHSAEIAQSFLESLRLNPIAKKVVPIIDFHMRPHRLSDASDKSYRKLLRDLSEQGVEWEDLMNMASADAGAKTIGLTPETEAEYNGISDRIRRVQTEMSTKQIDPRGCILNGNEIMQAMGRDDPGEWIKKAKNWLKDLQDSNPDLTKEDAVKGLREQFKEKVGGDSSLVVSAQSRGNISKTLLDEKEKQILELVKNKPLEAVSLAVDLWRNSPEDDRALKLWLKSVVLAKTIGGKNLATNAALGLSSRLVKKDYCDPESISLYLACKMILCKPLTKDDISSFKRANHLDSRITRGILGELFKEGNH